MTTLSVDVNIEWNPPVTQRCAELIRMFGLRVSRYQDWRLHHRYQLTLKPGQICFIGGGSGSGKTVLLNALYEQAPADQRLRLEDIPLEQDAAVIDCVQLPAMGLFGAADQFCQAGLSDVLSLLNCPSALSAGQQWRYKLCRALNSGKRWIFIDEFTDSLDRITATAVAYNLRKWASKSETIFVVASCHEDVLYDLRPDIIVLKQLNGRTQTIFKDTTHDPLGRTIVNS